MLFPEIVFAYIQNVEIWTTKLQIALSKFNTTPNPDVVPKICQDEL